MLSRVAAFCCMMTIAGFTLGAPGNSQGGDPRVVHGREVFLTYCAGCHGFNGFAFYSYAPSFAMGDRMDLSDAQLMHSILKGRNAMPSWEGKLPFDWLTDALAYLRYMDRMSRSNKATHNGPPSMFFVFPAYGGQLQPDWPISADY